MNIGYFADGPWSHKAFMNIISRKEVKIKFICARFDIPDNTLRDYAAKYQIPFLVSPNINSADFINREEVRHCDLFVSMSFNQIFRENTFKLPRLGTINCHAGKLPFYRGRNILNWALINDEKEFGITVHYVDTGVDTGDIIKQKDFEIYEHDDYSTLLNRAYSGCSDILSEVIDDFLTDKITRTKQDTINPLGLYCSARKVGDEKLDWQQSSREIFNFVRAICKPGPRARTNLGDFEVKINKVKYFPSAPTYKGVPGAILAKIKDGFLVKTKDSYICLLDWESSVSLKVGDRLI